MEPRARAVMLTNYAEVARHVGLNPHVMLGRAGLHASALRDPENWLPGQRVLSLIDESAVRAKRDDFGVILGERRTFASLGPVSLLLRHEATLRDIINSAIEYRRLLNEFLQLELRELGGGTILEWNLVPGLRSAQGIRLLATIAYRVLVEGAGVEWQPECIHFRDSPPARIGTFRRVFNCALEFDSHFDGMSFSSTCLDLPNKYADGELMVQARRLLNLMPGIRREETIVERARAAVPFLIADGKLRADDMARCLGMSVRTLQRRLVEEGRSFSSLLNEARRELAIRYLSNTNQPITEVAHSTGYSSLSSFTRWFISQFGVSPGQWRRTMRRRDAAPLSQRDVPDEP